MSAFPQICSILSQYQFIHSCMSLEQKCPGLPDSSFRQKFSRGLGSWKASWGLGRKIKFRLYSLHTIPYVVHRDGKPKKLLLMHCLATVQLPSLNSTTRSFPLHPHPCTPVPPGPPPPRCYFRNAPLACVVRRIPVIKACLVSLVVALSNQRSVTICPCPGHHG